MVSGDLGIELNFARGSTSNIPYVVYVVWDFRDCMEFIQSICNCRLVPLLTKSLNNPYKTIFKAENFISLRVSGRLYKLM